MLLNEVLPLIASYWPLLLVGAVVAYLLRNKHYNGLNKYPGPWLAQYTNWWRFFDVFQRKTEHTHIRLHRQYGDFVRLGPNVLSIGNPQAIKEIYGLNKGFTKSDFYPVQQGTSKGHRLLSMFSSQDEKYHAAYRRSINNAFTMSTLASYEPLVDSTMRLFLDQTERLFANTGKICNFGEWLQYFAFDVIGELVWSRRLGFVDRNEDVGGIIGFLNGFLQYCALIGQIPFLDLLIDKNPLKLLLQRLNIDQRIFPITAFALSCNSSRSSEMEKIRTQGLPPNIPPGGIDMLSKFSAACYTNPTFMTPERVLTTCVSMIFAGSETTAISLTTVFYYLLKYPTTYIKLMQELDEAVLDGRIDDKEKKEGGLVSWSESQKLPYLDAVIQESFRIYPAAGLILERVVPSQGATICSQHIPGGTIVGCNAWVLHRNETIFGSDVDVFRPERWLEASSEQLKIMKATMFQFGAGSRTCIGKNISLMEVYKLVPSFLRRFKVRFDREGREWETRNGWFVRQSGFWARFERRGDGTVREGIEGKDGIEKKVDVKG